MIITINGMFALIASLKMRMKLTHLGSLAVALVCSGALACNIPVFRYALERWRTDVTEIVVLLDEPLTEAQSQELAKLGYRPGEPANQSRPVTFRLVETHQDLSAEDQSLWNSVKANRDLSFPYLVIRNSYRRGPIHVWQGALNDSGTRQLVQSPVRDELARRLLSGHSIVWLMVRSADETRNLEARQVIQEQCRVLSRSVKLPEGIGLPGSELFSNIPLLLKFSLLEIDPSDVNESFLVSLFSAYQPAAVQEGVPLVIPVFGRGRALEVVPADQLDTTLIADLTQFLCAACSCQVKEQNPGFDLLLSVNWDQELFGEGGMLPPPPNSPGSGGKAAGPRLLTIPSGHK
ncbi:MAG: hypothetical protein KDB22_03265 [Planctomycetales bacterium]|nr:hypothetical protein [Planctomycetales bacterium]